MKTKDQIKAVQPLMDQIAQGLRLDGKFIMHLFTPTSNAVDKYRVIVSANSDPAYGETCIEVSKNGERCADLVITLDQTTGQLKVLASVNNDPDNHILAIYPQRNINSCAEWRPL